MASDLGMTENELLAALEAALGTDEGDSGLSVQDLATISGKTPDRVRKGLRVLKSSGLLESTRVRRERLDGAITLVPGYRLRRGGDDG